MLVDVIRSILRGTRVELMDVVMQILAVLFIIFCILPLHELAHGWTAYKLGDSTAKYQGRLTLNPLASVEPMGALFLLLFGFGWAKPVPVDKRYFKNPKRDMAIVALAGPISNVIAALVGALILLGLQVALKLRMPIFLITFFFYYIVINVGLAAFNLIPIPPLDGSKILGAFLSNKALYNYYRYQNIIEMTALLLLFLGVLDAPIGFLQSALYNGIMWLASIPYGLFGLL